MRLRRPVALPDADAVAASDARRAFFGADRQADPDADADPEAVFAADQQAGANHEADSAANRRAAVSETHLGRARAAPDGDSDHGRARAAPDVFCADGSPDRLPPDLSATDSRHADAATIAQANCVHEESVDVA